MLLLGNAVAALAVLPFGWAADRVGRRAILVATGLAGTLGAATLVPLTDWRPSVVSSALYWSSTAALPIMSAHVAAVVPRERLGRSMGLVYGAFFAGNIIAAPWSGALGAALGLRNGIAISALAFAISTFAMSRVGRGTVEPGASGGRPPRSFWALLAIVPFASFLAVLPTPLLPVYLRDVAGVPLERIGVIAAFFAIGAAVLSAVSGPLADRFGPAVVVFGNVIAVALGGIALAFARSEPALAVGIFLLGAAFAVNPVMAATIERVLPRARVSLAYASFQLAYIVGFGAGGMAAGVLYAADPFLPYLATAALALPIGAIVALAASRLRAVA